MKKALIFLKTLFVEIILRLPVKSILKFRCVSKPWLSLISSQKFIKTHTRVSTENSELNSHIVIVTNFSHSQSNLTQCSLPSLLCEQPLSDTLNVFDYPYAKHPPEYVQIVGCCDGLICICVNVKHLVLWNPSTKKSKVLPSMGPGLDPCPYGAFGFGFYESNDDYKIVRVFQVFEEGFKYITMVYGLRTDSWTRVGDLEGGILLEKSIKFANGKIHWAATPEREGPNYSWDIVCLDLESGVYGTVEQPDYEEDDFDRTLGMLGGCICVLRYDIDAHVDVWVLKEYGVKSSWSRVFHFSLPDYAARFEPLKPLCLLSNGEILLIYGRSFVVCNPRYGSFKVLKTTNLDICGQVDIFVESLVSLDMNEEYGGNYIDF